MPPVAELIKVPCDRIQENSYTNTSLTNMSMKAQDPIGSIPINQGSPSNKERDARGSRLSPPPAKRPPQRPRRNRRLRYQSYLFKTALVCATLLLLYLAVSFLLFPLLAPEIMAGSLERKLGRPVTIARAQWQPFSGIMLLHNGIVGPLKNEPYDKIDPLLSFRNLRLKLNMSAIFKGDPLVEQAEVEHGFIHLTRDREGGYNLSLTHLLQLFHNRPPQRLTFEESRILFSDLEFTPPFTIELNEAKGEIRPDPANPESLSLLLEGSAPGGGELRLQGRIGNRNGEATARFEFSGTGFDPGLFSPYLTGVLSNNIEGGSVSWQGEIVRNGWDLALEQHLIFAQLTIGKPEGDGVNMTPYLIMHTDREGKLELPVSLKINLSHRDNPLRRELHSFFVQLAKEARQAPMEELAEQFPDLELKEEISFKPGRAELSRGGGATLDQIAAALNRRPLLGLKVQGFSDSGCDKKALMLQREENIRELRRQAVEAIARKLAGERENRSTPHSDPPIPREILNPKIPEVEPGDLLELAKQRGTAVIQRLEIAMGERGSTRLHSARPMVVDTMEDGPAATKESGLNESAGCGAKVVFSFVSVQPSI